MVHNIGNNTEIEEDANGNTIIRNTSTNQYVRLTNNGVEVDSFSATESDISSDSQWKEVATVSAGSGVSSFDVDLTGEDYDVYRVEPTEMTAGGSTSTDLWMRFDGLADARYQYVREGDTRTRISDATEMEVSEMMRATDSQGIQGRLDIYTSGRVHVIGSIVSGWAVDNATLQRGVHYDVHDTLNTITFLTPPADGVNFDANATVVVSGRNF